MGFHSISLTFFGFSLNFVCIFWLSLNFVYLFLNIQLSALIRIKYNKVALMALYYLMAQAVSWRLESIQLMTQSTFQELTKNQLMTQVDSTGIDSILTHDSKSFPIFWFKSTHDSSENPLILSRLMIRLWVIPMSGGPRDSLEAHWLTEHRQIYWGHTD